jgi:hypothetical protein
MKQTAEREDLKPLVVRQAEAVIEQKQINWTKYFLLVVAATTLIASILGWINYFKGVSVFSVITWQFIPLGIFVWGDAMILGTFLFVASVYLYFKQNTALTGLFFSAYFMIRSLIEALYNLNAQFSSVSRPWEGFIQPLADKLNFKIQEMFVVPQITYTAVCVVSLVFFVVFLKKYITER